jgi:hypothetical protein
LNRREPRERRRRRARVGGPSYRSSATTLIVALSLLLQFVLSPFHQALLAADATAPDAALVAADLKAIFGDTAAICVRTDDRRGPAAPAGDCGDHCVLCQFAAHAATLTATGGPVLPVRRGDAFALNFPPEIGTLPLLLTGQSRARAPPFVF